MSQDYVYQERSDTMHDDVRHWSHRPAEGSGRPLGTALASTKN